MNIERGKISNLQFTILVAGLILCSDPIMFIVIVPAKNNGWLAVIAALAAGSIILYIFTSLAQRFPGKNLIQINSIIYGRYMGTLISIGYLWYFFHLITINTLSYSLYYVNTTLRDTPLVVICFAYILIAFYALRKGFEVIVRSIVFIVPMIVLVVFISEFLLLKEMKLKNLLPFMEVPAKDFLSSTFAITTINFGEIVTVLMIMGSVNNVKKLKKSILTGLAIGGVLLVIIALTTTMVLGPVEGIAYLPSFHMYRLINVGDLFTRMESLFLGILQAMAYVRITFYFYVTVLAAAQLLKMRSYLPLILPVGIIATNIAYTQAGIVFSSSDFGVNTYPYYAISFVLLIPLLSLILVSMKGKRNTMESECP